MSPALSFAFLLVSGALVTGPTITPISGAATVGRVFECRIEGVAPAPNPYDPDTARVDVVVVRPNAAPARLPAFWYQPYTRALEDGREVLTPAGAGEWRFRITPLNPGRHALRATAVVGGTTTTGKAISFVAAPAPLRGFIRRSPANERYLMSADGKPFLAIGANYCWPGVRGTYDYDDWLPAMQTAGMNYARIWMCPWAFGCEVTPSSLNRYDQAPLWTLDTVLRRCEETGVHAMLCLDYHGMLNTVPDYWGGNDNWKVNPYNSANGGPCASPNEFFTSPEAKTIYKKRLRYLVARFGYSPNLAAWEFWNEIDNDFGWLNRPDVLAWHKEMGAYLHAIDPYRHLVTTSLAWQPWPELWSLKEMDFAQIHSYGQTSPTVAFAQRAAEYVAAFHKPVWVGEYGVDYRGHNVAADPYGRALHQVLWSTLHSGMAGCAHSWWWEDLHNQNVYPEYARLSAYLASTGLGAKGWNTMAVQTPDLPNELRARDDAAQPFDAQLTLDSTWAGQAIGEVYCNDRATTQMQGGRLNCFVHGRSHADLKRPFRIHAHFNQGSTAVLHLNSVSNGAVLRVVCDGQTLLERALPNLDGKWEVNNEYNEDIPVAIPAGDHLLEVLNSGDDWFYLDWVKLTNLQPSVPSADGPIVRAFAVGNGTTALLYVLDGSYDWPAGATDATITPLSGAKPKLLGLPDGAYLAVFYSPTSGSVVGRRQLDSSGGVAPIPTPTFDMDLAAKITPVPSPTRRRPSSGR